MTLLKNPPPQDAGELFVAKKRELSSELYHFRHMEDQCWQQKARISG